MAKLDSEEQEILDLTGQLLRAITSADWQTYHELCDESLTAFEPEADGHLVQGMSFHRHYFDLADASPYVGVTTTIASPHIRVMNDVAVIAYVRLTQRTTADSNTSAKTTTTTSCEETRVWQKQDGTWQHVHFHRSR